jgi:Kef-type K+ transport system membrane component KefB
MAVASTRLIKQVDKYSEKLLIIFGPLFFAIIGAQVAGCGIPSIIFLKDRSKALRVGIGMISRGEVGLIVAGVGVSAGVLTSDIYTTVIIMVALTTIITPIWLKRSFLKDKDTNLMPQHSSTS